ncbi:MAG: hypothetical protein ABFR32_12380 [Bacteroidota bacterium]
MRKIFMLTFFIAVSNLIAQNKITMTLRDGSILTGIGKIGNYNKIIFKKDKNDEKSIYDYKSVKNIVITYGEKERKYEYKIVEGNTNTNGNSLIKLLEPIDIGNVNLFGEYSYGAIPVPMGSNGTGMNMMYSSSPKTTYFLSRKGEDIVTQLYTNNTYSKKFMTIAEKYFEDCPKLLNKIKSKHFNRYGIESIVSYYNNYCEN